MRQEVQHNHPWESVCRHLRTCPHPHRGAVPHVLDMPAREAAQLCMACHTPVTIPYDATPPQGAALHVLHMQVRETLQQAHGSLQFVEAVAASLSGPGVSCTGLALACVSASKDGRGAMWRQPVLLPGTCMLFHGWRRAQAAVVRRKQAAAGGFLLPPQFQCSESTELLRREAGIPS